MSRRESKAHARRGGMHAPRRHALAAAVSAERAWDKRNPVQRRPGGLRMGRKEQVVFQLACRICGPLGKPEEVREGGTGYTLLTLAILVDQYHLKHVRPVDRLAAWFLSAIRQQHQAQMPDHTCYLMREYLDIGGFRRNGQINPYLYELAVREHLATEGSVPVLVSPHL